MRGSSHYFHVYAALRNARDKTEEEKSEAREPLIKASHKPAPRSVSVGDLSKASSAADFILMESVGVRASVRAGRNEHRVAADEHQFNVCKVSGCLRTEELTSCSVCK